MMRSLTEEEVLFLTTARAQLRSALAAHDAAEGYDKATMAARDRALGVLGGVVHSPQLREFIHEIQSAVIVEMEAAIVAAFTPFFTCGRRCALRAHETDAYRTATKRLDDTQSGLDAASTARAMVAVLDTYFGE